MAAGSTDGKSSFSGRRGWEDRAIECCRTRADATLEMTSAFPSLRGSAPRSLGTAPWRRAPSQTAKKKHGGGPEDRATRHHVHPLLSRFTSDAP